VADREKAIALAKTDTDAALGEARAIKDPWYACQALAWTARFASKERFESIVREAVATAAKNEDFYKRVAVAAWPLRAMSECGRHDLILEQLPGLLLVARCILPPSSRSEALFLIFQAVRLGPRELWIAVLNELLEASLPIEHWRQGRNLQDTVAMVLKEDIALARQILDRTEEGRTRRRIERILTMNCSSEPRAFF
jgi:hypothetical protein